MCLCSLRGQWSAARLWIGMRMHLSSRNVLWTYSQVHKVSTAPHSTCCIMRCNTANQRMKFMESSSFSSVDGRGVGRCTPAPVALLTDSLSGDGGSSLAGTAMALFAMDSESWFRSTAELGGEVV